MPSEETSSEPFRWTLWLIASHLLKLLYRKLRQFMCNRTGVATSIHKFYISTVSVDCRGWTSTVWTSKEGKAEQQHQTDILQCSSCLLRALNANHVPSTTLHEHFGFSYLSQSYCQVICFKLHVLNAKAAPYLSLNIILLSKNVIQIFFLNKSIETKCWSFSKENIPLINV